MTVVSAASIRGSAWAWLLLMGLTLTPAGLLAQEPDRIKVELFREADAAMQRAQQAEVPFLAPTLYARAGDFYRRAEQDYERGDRLNRIRERLAQAVQVLNEAMEAAEVSKLVLAPIIAVRGQVAELEFVGQLAPDKLNQAERAFQEAVRKAESGDIRGARDRIERALRRYREATVEALEKGPLQQAKTRLEQARPTLTRERYDAAKRELDVLRNAVHDSRREEFEIPALVPETAARIDAIGGGILALGEPEAVIPSLPLIVPGVDTIAGGPDSCDGGFIDPSRCFPELFGTDGTGGNLIKINFRTGQGTIVGPLGIGPAPALAVDPYTGILYAGGGRGRTELFTVDPGTGRTTLVGSTGFSIGDMDFTSNGSLIATVDFDTRESRGSDHLAYIDTDNGAARIIGPFGACFSLFGGATQCVVEGIEAIAFDADDNLWGARSPQALVEISADPGSAAPVGLYTIDISTGAASFVNPILDATGNPPYGGVVSLQFRFPVELLVTAGAVETLFGGTALLPWHPPADHGRLITIDRTTGNFSFVGSSRATELLTSLAALALAVASPTPVALPPPPPPEGSENRMGINILESMDTAPDKPFVDVMKVAREFHEPGPLPTPRVPVDAVGWPTTDFQVIVWAGIANMDGTYQLSFPGRGDETCRFPRPTTPRAVPCVDVIGGGDERLGHPRAELRRIVYDRATNRSTADVFFPYTGPGSLTLEFTGTSGGMRDIRLRRPMTQGGTDQYPATTIFTDQLMTMLDKFSTIRFMNWTATNSNQQREWRRDRVLPYAASFNRGANLVLVPEVPAAMSPTGEWIEWIPPIKYGWQGFGASWESVIQMANAAGKDAWINVPHKASPDYVRGLALLFRNGSTFIVDGVTYTYPALRSDLRLYVEFGNELWNTASGDFAQTWENLEAAQEEVARGGSPLDFDIALARFDPDPMTGGPRMIPDYILAARRVALQGAEISKTFRRVFGEAQMMTRIRPVLMWQFRDGNATGSEALSFVERWYGPRPGNRDPPQPVSYYFYGGGAAAYYYPDNESHTLNITDIWTSNTFDNGMWRAALPMDTHLALAYGLRRIAYEGGPSMDCKVHSPIHVGDPPPSPHMPDGSLCTEIPRVEGHSEDVKRAAVDDGRMRGLVIEHHRAWSRQGGDLLVYLSDAGDYQWGFTSDIVDLDTPKYRAIDRLRALVREPPVIGTEVPRRIEGTAYDAANPVWLEEGTRDGLITSGQWMAYTIRVPSDRPVGIRISYCDATSGATLDVRVDGITVGRPIPTTVGATHTTGMILTMTLTEGLHSIRIGATSGDFLVVSVEVM